MKHIYHYTQRAFERLVSVAMAILGNSITFIIALASVIFWLTNKKFYTQDIHDSFEDVLVGITFLSLFMIQRSVTKSMAALHLKMNELIASHEPASNAVIDAEDKTEHQVAELSKEYIALSKLAQKPVEGQQ